MRSQTSHINQLVQMGMYLAASLILSWVETVLPLTFGLPGMKLGLANLAVVLCLYMMGPGHAFVLTIAKALLSGFLFGNATMLLYNLAGAICSCLMMALLKKSRLFHIPVISAAGGVLHNVGQLFVAFFMIQTYGVLYYVPILLLAGLITGIIIGTVAALILPALQKMQHSGGDQL